MARQLSDVVDTIEDHGGPARNTKGHSIAASVNTILCGSQLQQNTRSSACMQLDTSIPSTVLVLHVCHWLCPGQNAAHESVTLHNHTARFLKT